MLTSFGFLIELDLLYVVRSCVFGYCLLCRRKRRIDAMSKMKKK
jgi:hypothetical protein